MWYFKQSYYALENAIIQIKSQGTFFSDVGGNPVLQHFYIKYVISIVKFAISFGRD